MTDLFKGCATLCCMLGVCLWAAGCNDSATTPTTPVTPAETPDHADGDADANHVGDQAADTGVMEDEGADNGDVVEPEVEDSGDGGGSTLNFGDL